jgi:hypothetical protein
VDDGNTVTRCFYSIDGPDVEFVCECNCIQWFGILTAGDVKIDDPLKVILMIH